MVSAQESIGTDKINTDKGTMVNLVIGILIIYCLWVIIIHCELNGKNYNEFERLLSKYRLLY
ncbi:hypothetical protein KOSB73_380007 [Klebsiella grimontii]|uniref:Uncharacterized protein n=1 Tax=Klebsiella grimontii TaxID=2058152 RepID=A0A285B977_9ENTR|nr:hypothetical protein KOSB73_380007 [Klebsiella grimontii]